MVGEVVVDPDPARLATQFHASFHVLETAQCRAGIPGWNAGMACRGDSGEGVHAVVFAL